MFVEKTRAGGCQVCINLTAVSYCVLLLNWVNLSSVDSFFL